MNDATEYAYKNGFAQGYDRGYADGHKGFFKTTWIPAAERLPEEVGNYLVIWHDDEGTYMDIMWRYPDGNFTFEISLLDWWMPLPEMPEIKEGQK